MESHIIATVTKMICECFDFVDFSLFISHHILFMVLNIWVEQMKAWIHLQVVCIAINIEIKL